MNTNNETISSPSPSGRKRRRWRWAPLLLAFLSVGVLGAMRENRTGGDIAWARSYQEGQKTAEETHQPLMLVFHAPGCGWCRKLDSETFTDPQVVELSRKYVCVRLNSEEDSALTSRYGVTEFPMTVFVAPNGKEILRATGYIPPDRFAPALEKLLKVEELAATDSPPAQ